MRKRRAGRPVALLAAFALSAGLSCSVWPALPTPPAAPSPEPIGEIGPTHVDLVEGHFQRYRTRLAGFEIRSVAHSVVQTAREHRIEPALFLALIRTESGFDAFAVSEVGALGLTQVMPATGREVAGRLGIEWRGPRTLFDPVLNVRIGGAYLAELRARYGGRWERALAAYNWGPGRIDARLRGGQRLPVAYASKVLADRSHFTGAL